MSVDKPRGLTSMRVVERTKAALGVRKAGHAGTLDPMATGVLLVCVGRATKLFDALQRGTKEYRATVQLGAATDTYDAEGAVTERGDVPSLSPEEVERALKAFRGEILQVPPMYSALKRGGQPLYKLARKGQDVKREARPVTIHALDLVALGAERLELHIACSKGTYVRSLAHDLGGALGCGGHLAALRRTASGPFCADDATPLAEIEAEPNAARRLVIPLDEVRTLLDP